MSKGKSEDLLSSKIEPMESGDLNDEKLFKEQKKKYILKGLSSIISCIFHTCGYYSIFILGHTVVYLISFRRHYNPNLTFSHGYFLFPIMYFTLSVTVTIGGIVETKIGGKKTIFLSTLILCLSFTMMYFSRNLYLDYLLMSFIGFGIALGIKLSKRNACAYFMKRKVLISGIVTLVPSLVNAGLAIFYEKYILNPLGESPTIDNSYYDEKIFLNFQKLLLFEIGFLIFVCILSLLTFFKNDLRETYKFGFGESEHFPLKKKMTKEMMEIRKSNFNKALYSKRTVKLCYFYFSLQ